MREVELKSVVDDVPARRRIVEAAGGILTFEGSLSDSRYGDAAGMLIAADHVLRLRVYTSAGKSEGFLDWKGPTTYENGYKVREELSSPVGDSDAMGAMLGNLGYAVILEIERTIAQYTLLGATVRFEQYPRMDPLVEVEGTPAEIEAAIGTLGLDRAGFSSDRLMAFVLRFEARTAQKAALSSRELSGDYRFSPQSA